MARRRPLTPQQFAEIAEAARGRPDGKMLRETIQGLPPLLSPRRLLAAYRPRSRNAGVAVHGA